MMFGDQKQHNIASVTTSSDGIIGHSEILEKCVVVSDDFRRDWTLETGSDVTKSFLCRLFRIS